MIEPLFENEILKKRKYTRVVGIDEVGRGCLAGPLVVCAFAYHLEDDFVTGVNDSKKLSKKSRESKAGILSQFEHKIVQCDAEQIDQIGLAKALKDLFFELYSHFNTSETFFLIDGNHSQSFGENALKVIKGDSTYYSIAAASILAKVYRDEIMSQASILYPEYDFQNNVGYGTAKHIQAIRQHGYTQIHRKSFKLKI